MFIANITIDFHYFNLFRFYWKYFNIIFTFFLYSFGETKFLYANKLLPFKIKSVKPIQKYPHVTESYACILEIFV